MADYGCDPTGGFNAVTKAYKANPTLENYLALRKKYPDAEIEVAIHGGIDQLFFMEPELARFGIAAADFASVFDANPDAISHFSLFFMERYLGSKVAKKGGETHLARRGLVAPDKLIDWFITCALNSLSWTDEWKFRATLSS